MATSFLIQRELASNLMIIVVQKLGYKAPKTEQNDIIDGFLNGTGGVYSAFFLTSTGFGKSLHYPCLPNECCLMSSMQSVQ